MSLSNIPNFLEFLLTVYHLFQAKADFFDFHHLRVELDAIIE